MIGLYLGAGFLTLLGLCLGFLHKIEKQDGPRTLLNRDRKGGE